MNERAMTVFNSALITTLQKYSDIEEDKINSIIVTSSDYAKIIQERLMKENTDTAILVLTPHNMRNDTFDKIIDKLESGHTIQYAIYQKNNKNRVYRLPQVNLISGDIHNLADTIAALREDAHKIIQDLTEAILVSADKLQIKDKKYIIKKTAQKSWSGASQSASLILFSGILMQQYLAKYRDDIPSINSATNAEFLLKTWNYIINLNRFNIFRPAVEILNALSTESSASANDTVRPLINLIINTKNTTKTIINTVIILLPQLSDDRSTAAEYYTREPIAEMLALLTIKDIRHDMNYFKEHKIADLTCGTGTLLSAGYRRIRSLHKRYHGLSGLKELYHSAINGGLIGVDISPMAVHLAMVSLFLADNGYGWYNPTGLARVEVGGPSAMTGAIEYIKEQGYFSNQNIPRIPDESIDYILMNPPYSRSRNGQASFDIVNLTDAQRHACQARWEDLIRKYPARKVAGMAPTFVIIASKKIKKGGRIGFVLPITAAFAEAWADTREFIQHNYTDIMAITVSSGKSLSHNTHLTEMLLIGTKTAQPKKTPSSIHCITLGKAPINTSEAGEMARAIQNSSGNILDLSSSIHLGDVIGTTYKYDAKPGMSWSPLGVRDSHMALFVDLLVQGKFRKDDGIITPFNIQMACMQEIFCIGPTHHMIGHTEGNFPSGAFELHMIDDIDTIHEDVQYSLWNVSKSQDRLITQPTHYGIPIGKSENITRQNTTLFYNRRLSWASNALLGATTKDRIMGGNGWLGLGHADVRVLKMAALWFNSTMGLMTHWSQASRSEPGRATAQIKAIKNIPCPRFDTLSDSALCKAAKFFDDTSSTQLLPACYVYQDKARHVIDKIVLETLGLHDVDMEDIRVRFCQEPTIHNYAKKPMDALNLYNGYS